MRRSLFFLFKLGLLFCFLFLVMLTLRITIDIESTVCMSTNGHVLVDYYYSSQREEPGPGPRKVKFATAGA